MRRFASRIGVLRTLALVAAIFGLLVGTSTSRGFSKPLANPGSFRLLYASDWSGTSEIYAADPNAPRAPAQLTFGRAPACEAAACGYRDATPSPNGRFVLYTDWSVCNSSHPSSLFVVRADGTHPRTLARSRSSSTCPGGIEGVWAPDSKRIAYAVDGRIHTVDAEGGHNRIVGRGDRVSWSPDGRSIAFSAVNPSGGYGPLSVRQNGRTRVVAAIAADFEWSPDGRWIAFSFRRVPGAADELDIVRPDATGGRSLRTAGYIGDLQWSADSRFVSDGSEVMNIRSGAIRALGGVLAWRPDGHDLAVTRPGGTYVVDAATGTARLLTRDQAAVGRWSPDGRNLAYITRATGLNNYVSADLRVVTVARKPWTIVHGAGAYGGDVSELAWTRVPSGTRYHRAHGRVLAVVRDDALTAPWSITRLAADGERVAYVSCGHVFVWTPTARTVVQAEPNSSLSPRCTTYGYYLPFWLYTLALSGERIAFGDLMGNMGQSWELYAGRVGNPASFVSLDSVGSANGCAVGSGGLGDLTGADGLLVFSRWRDDLACPATTLEQEIHRADARGCPCPLVATSPGPLVPLDVDGGHIVAGGNNATVILDPSGARVLSIPVSPLAAQLSGADLVILVRGRLLVYDAATGTQLHAWTLPDVPSGGECASPHSGTWECRPAHLVLEDAAHGLATYVLDGQVHILRLADGADSTVAPGTLARFMDAGLVYADRPTLHVVPFDRIPLR
jgi:Tol biopolymer transport system component